MRRVRIASAVVGILGGLIALCVMSADVRFRLGFFLALGGVGALVGSTIVFASTFSPQTAASHSTTFRALAPELGIAFTSCVVFIAALRLVVGGVFSKGVAACVVTALALGVLVCITRVRDKAVGDERPMWRRHGFWLVAAQTLLSLPSLGSFGLLDPWEAHYGEVAREIIARNDWISTWWAHEGWFTSKPVLDLWLQALSMSCFGVHAEPGAMLVGIGNHVARPEWAIRFPGFLLQVVGLYLFYKGAARAFGHRAGFLSALVLMTMAEWVFLGHQSITDVPLVMCMAGVLGLMLIALSASSEERMFTLEVHVGRSAFQFTVVHLVLAGVLFVVLPQAIYLLSRNVDLQLHASPHGFRPHVDVFSAGSGGNCGIAGQLRCLSEAPQHAMLQPALQAALWLVAIGLVVALVCNENRTRSVAILGVWMLSAFATMAKGPVGLVLPVGTLVVYAAVTRQWRLLLSFEWIAGLMLSAAMVLPWYIATYARHGRFFFDDLVLRHMIGRTLQHLHDTNEGDDTSFRFYLWQLGYACFPWTGLVPAALLGWGRSFDRTDKVSIAPLSIWFVLGFTLFSVMSTKFHHYIAPAVIPLAMLVGVWLDRAVHVSQVRDRASVVAAALVGCIVTTAVGFDLVTDGDAIGQGRLLQLFTYQYHRTWPEELNFKPVLAGGTIVAATVTLLLAVARWRAFVTKLFVAFAMMFALWALNVYLVKLAPHWGQREVIETYYQQRFSSNEPLVAYQLNWKGENFYAGNKLALFVSSGPPLRDYLRKIIATQSRSLYFVLEHSRLVSLKSEVSGFGSTPDVTVLTTSALNNKFCLVHVVYP